MGLITRMREAGERKVVAEKEFEERWRQTILALASMTLVPDTKSVCSSLAILQNPYYRKRNAYCLKI